jgi:F-box-like
MGDARPVCRKWDDMEIDVLVKIFKLLNMVDMAPVSQVCRLWRYTCSDPLIWKTIDLSRLKSNFIQIKVPPNIWVADPSDKCLFRVLKLAMALSRGNVSCMIFHYYLYMKDEHLSYVTER